MANLRSSYADRDGRLRWAKRPLLILLVVVAVLGSLSVAERDSSSSASGDPIARRGRVSGFSGFESLFGSGSVAGRATAVPVPTAPGTGGATGTGDGNVATLPNGAVAESPTAALGIAQQTATQGIQQAQAAVGVAQQIGDPFITAIVCPILLQVRAQVVTIFNALEAAFPFLAAQLNAIEASALAIIDALAARFGCPPISG